MYIYFDDSVADVDFAENKSSLDCIENIMRAAFDGYHFVFAARELLTQLENEILLDRRAKAAAQRVRNRFSELGSVTKNIRSRLRVCGNIRSVEPDGSSGSCWKVPLHTFQRSLSVAQIVLLAEDLTDAKIYKFAGEHTRIRRRLLGDFRLACNCIGGGGSSVARQLQEYINQPDGFCLTIVDSDRLAPKAPLGDTAQKCEDAVDGAQPFVQLFVLPVRALENTIPLRILEKALDDKVDALDCMSNIVNSGACALLDFCALKSDVSLSQLLEGHSNSSVQKFHSDSVDILMKIRPDLAECAGDGKCSSYGACRCRVFEGLGDRCSVRTLCWLKRRGVHASAKVAGVTDEAWTTIGDLVCDWALAMHQMRS